MSSWAAVNGGVSAALGRRPRRALKPGRGQTFDPAATSSDVVLHTLSDGRAAATLPTREPRGGLDTSKDDRMARVSSR